MVLECLVINDSYYGPEVYHKVFIGRFPGFYKLFRVDCHQMKHVGPVVGLTGALLWSHLSCAGCWIGCDGVAMCLLARFLSCPVAEVSMGSISKSKCRCFIGVTMSNFLMLGVDGTSGSVGGACGWKSGSCQGGLARRALIVGRMCCK